MTSKVASSSTDARSGYSSAQVATSPELESTLQMLSSHRTVLGVMLLSRASPPAIIRHSGVVFEGEQGKKYAKAVGRMVEACKTGLDEIDGESQDDMKFMRIRTKRYEIMISPDDRYLLVVLHDPTAA
ncbi:hypothetical protein FRC14_006729 [Serendipita sp. 396]|nr:hypothetical protein FRC14_006729 [Serendipita sp. 396]KAG8778589.1 hypothetical protein FRC15_010658 [Serendipita sp. 397]KAG8828691.1 hypothetical protein FRC19_000079 [Serendipita sp. 401]KAG8847000.1 hypothetical protein FRB91_000295 [Serendipita sp. 411]KAG8863915.1 hypothetical protein FRC20_010458 [Serendipita sp. 405]KAG9058858.1 hypothetical protein FS842_000055 [Serendipita sp. 407]